MFLFCCLLIGAVIAGLVLIPRHLRHSTLQRLGWFWNDKPDLRITAGLNLPPFGIGMNRIVKQHVVGRSRDRKSTRLNSSHQTISYAVFCLKKKKIV